MFQLALSKRPSLFCLIHFYKKDCYDTSSIAHCLIPPCGHFSIWKSASQRRKGQGWVCIQSFTSMGGRNDFSKTWRCKSELLKLKENWVFFAVSDVFWYQNDGHWFWSFAMCQVSWDTLRQWISITHDTYDPCQYYKEFKLLTVIIILENYCFFLSF